MIHPSPSHLTASALSPVFREETEPGRGSSHPGEEQKAGVCPPTLRFLFAFNPPPSTAHPRRGEIPTARLSAVIPRPGKQAPRMPALTLFFPWPYPGASALYPGTPGTLLSSLPSRATLTKRRPGTVRAGFEAKCIFSLGKQAGAGVLHSAQLLTSNFEPPGSFLPH